MNRKARRWLLLLSGWGFILLGIAGLFLPFLQGILFILIGLVILSGEYAWAHNLLQKVEQRFPKLAPLLHRASRRAKGTSTEPAQWQPQKAAVDKDQPV